VRKVYLEEAERAARREIMDCWKQATHDVLALAYSSGLEREDIDGTLQRVLVELIGEYYE